MKQEEKTNILINNVHEYDYVKDVSNGITNHMLFYSNSETLSEHIQETLAGSIIDNGDGYQLSGNAKPDQKGMIDYHYAQQLEILLRLADLEQVNKYELSAQTRKDF